jgi:hypothetical protein
MRDSLAAAGASGRISLPPHLLAALVPLLVLVIALDVYCLIDLARAPSVRGVPKIVWVIIILFVSAPIGALIYLFVGRDRGRSHPPAPAAPASPAVPASPPGRASQPGLGPAAADGLPVVTTTGLTRDYGGTGLFDVDLLVPARP